MHNKCPFYEWLKMIKTKTNKQTNKQKTNYIMPTLLSKFDQTGVILKIKFMLDH